MSLSRWLRWCVVVLLCVGLGVGWWIRMPQRLLAWRSYTGAAAHLQNGQISQALASLQRALAHHPSFVQAYCMRGRLLLEQGALQQAQAALSRALALQPGAVCALYLRGQVRETLRDRKGALADYSRALQGRVSRLWGPARVMRYWLHRHRARIHLLEKRYAAATADYTQALQIRAEPLKLFKMRGKCRLQAGQPGGAVEDFLRVLKSRPYDDQSHYLLALAYHRQGQHKLALQRLQQALTLHPTRDLHRATLYYARSVIHMELGQLNKAQKDATQAIWNWTLFAPAYGMRSMISMAQRDFQQAITDCRKLLKLNPTLSGYAPTCHLLILAVKGDQKSFLKAYKAWRKLRNQKPKQPSFGWKLVNVPALSKTLERLLQFHSQPTTLPGKKSGQN